MATTLGCGQYDVVVMERGGNVVVGALEWTQTQWSRSLDDTSQADVDLLLGPKCCGILRQTRPWQHELLFIRDGEQVWAGPIIAVDLNGDTPKITARDMSAWWDHRLIHDDHTLVAQDLATIFQTIFADAMDPDNSSGQQLAVQPVSVNGDLTVLATDYKIAGPVLRDLAKAGLDWTIVVRDILAGGAAIPLTEVGPFLLEHFRDAPDVADDGTSQANRLIVTGQGSGAAGNAIVGQAVDIAARETFGLLESSINVSTYEDVASVDAVAAGVLAIAKDGLLVTQRAVLAPSAPFTISQLVPGALCSLNLDTCIPVVGDYRLERVQVVSSGGDERVDLTFQPLGALSVTG